jgi:hypothetical protein
VARLAKSCRQKFVGDLIAHIDKFASRGVYSDHPDLDER